jgi:hypothetical protein
MMAIATSVPRTDALFLCLSLFNCQRGRNERHGGYAVHVPARHCCDCICERGGVRANALAGGFGLHPTCVVDAL